MFLKNEIYLNKILFFSLIIFYSASAQDWQLVWSDEFQADTIDTSKWEWEVNSDGGGNNELQYYTARPENSFIEDGKLVIQALKETYTGSDQRTRSYTSARMRTKYKGDWKYGRIRVKAKLPYGQGLWPAIWMLPTDWVYGGWAASGEIDIMEYLGHDRYKIYGTIHYGGQWPDNKHTGSDYVDGSDFSADFHVYEIEWREGEVKWFVDGNHYLTLDDWYTTAGDFPAPFDQRFHLILNVAVGGNWPGNPDSTTTFPQRMEVDYIRVYQENVTSVSNGLKLPDDFTLMQNFPNPFNPTTQIQYYIPKDSFVIIKVYNSMGEEIITLVNKEKSLGWHTINFNAKDISSGIYYYRIIAINKINSKIFTDTKKLMLVK